MRKVIIMGCAAAAFLLFANGCEHCPPPGHETECPGGMPMNADGKCPRQQVNTDKKVA